MSQEETVISTVFHDRGCYTELESIANHRNGVMVSVRHDAVLKNEAGKTLERVTSRVSADKALDLLEAKAKKRLEEENIKRKPFKELKFRVNNITDMMFFNNDKAKPHSGNATYAGWDLKSFSGNKAVISVHNSGNYVMSFDMFDEGMKRIEVNLNGLSFWRHKKAEAKAFPFLFEAINDYLEVPLEYRKAEFGEE